MKEATVCTQCIYFHNVEPTGPRADVWYNHLCRASPLPKIVDPYDGQEKPYGVNDLGQQYFCDDREFDFCRKINKGDCSLFIKIGISFPLRSCRAVKK